MTAAFQNKPGLVQANHPGTSYAAAQAIAPSTGADWTVVFNLIATSASGMTDDELLHHFELVGSHIGANTARPRRVGLKDAGLVIDSGMRRHTRAGRKRVQRALAAGKPPPAPNAIVWIVNPNPPPNAAP